VPVFLLESYLPRSANALEKAQESARGAAEDGVAVRYLRTTLVPADETCMHLFEAASIEALEQAAARAGLAWDRIVEALSPTE
jgi:hypothetical protein